MIPTKIVSTTKITAKTLLSLLKIRHAQELCVPECKTGATFVGTPPLRLDLWVMRKSWKYPQVYGYEIKVSRQDFLKDNKWREYLRYCTDFYFCAPPGVIQPNELPPEAGLLVCSKNGKKLFCKKKAPSRSVDIPNDIYRYVLMWRTKYDDKQEGSTTDYWKNWIAKKKEDQDLGYQVSYRIRQILDGKVASVIKENKILKNENRLLHIAKKALSELDLTLKDIRWMRIENMKDLFIQKIGGEKVKVDKFLCDTIADIERVRKTIKGS